MDALVCNEPSLNLVESSDTFYTATVNLLQRLLGSTIKVEFLTFKTHHTSSIIPDFLREAFLSEATTLARYRHRIQRVINVKALTT